ncbi:MAG: IPT/TIG domain-containing protein [Parabacteroides sp.]|nr:IPT/TIG domain-containing protein [Parabacteroides sp.]
MKNKQNDASTHVEPTPHFCTERKSKRILIILFLFCMVVLLFPLHSCNGEEENVGKTHDPNKPIMLTDFSPDSGRISEMVLLDGENFGTDPSKIKVFFNAKEAAVIHSTGSRILALVPRLPGDTCTLSVEIGNQRKEYANFFRYKVAATVTTIAGNGNAPADNPDYTVGLDKIQLVPVYIGIDKDFNIFVSLSNNNLLKLNVAENSATVVGTGAQGYNHRCPPIANPLTSVLQTGSEDERDRFCFMDPKTGWIPKLYFIKKWDRGSNSATNKEYDMPGKIHYHCLLCESDGNYYTRYNDGQLVRINPKTWNATIVGMTPSGIAYGLAMHPTHKSELWIAYSNGAGDVSNSICKVDVTDSTVGNDDVRLASFQKLSGATNGAHRDGPLSIAQFNQPRGISFDSDGNLYVGDNQNQCIRIINTNTMMVETMIGIPEQRGFKDGSKDDALFSEPHGIVVDAEGNIFVSDFGNRRIRRIAIE